MQEVWIEYEVSQRTPTGYWWVYHKGMYGGKILGNLDPQIFPKIRVSRFGVIPKAKFWTYHYQRAGTWMMGLAQRFALYFICDWICQNPPHAHTMTRHSFHSQFNKLTNHHWHTTNIKQVCFCWDCFLRHVRCVLVLGWPWNSCGSP